MKEIELVDPYLESLRDKVLALPLGDAALSVSQVICSELIQAVTVQAGV